MSARRPDPLTWTILLGKWVEFAQASLALPHDAVGRRWKKSIAPIITLQAITFAAAEVGDLPIEERALALDKAEILLREAEADLARLWSGDARPKSIVEITTDARIAVTAAIERHVRH